MSKISSEENTDRSIPDKDMTQTGHPIEICLEQNIIHCKCLFTTENEFMTPTVVSQNETRNFNVLLHCNLNSVNVPRLIYIGGS